VLVESHFDQLVLAAALVCPPTDVFFTHPPVDVVDHEGCRGSWVGWALVIVTLLTLCALLLRRLSVDVVVAGGATGTSNLLRPTFIMCVPAGAIDLRFLFGRDSLIRALGLGACRRGYGAIVIGLYSHVVTVRHGRVLLRARLWVRVLAVDVDVEVVVVGHICCCGSSKGCSK
jgi:hypothetical protein